MTSVTHVLRTEFFRKLFGRSRKGDFFRELQDISLAEDTFRRATGYVLCFTMWGLIAFAVLLNQYEGDSSLVIPLGSVAISGLCGFAWLRLKKKAVFGPLYLLLGTLTLLGCYLLLMHGAPSGSSLFWFLLFPPMTMFCLGLRRGTTVFGVFFFLLLVLLLTPLQLHLAAPLPQPVRLRFLLAMLGAFVFSWSAEYIRTQTQLALKRIMARFEQESLTDPLTGLGNRRDFSSFMAWTMQNPSAKRSMFSIALVDIDHFKRINDTYGHDVGDKVLRHATTTLEWHIRATDRLYRWGGEEFLILMLKTDAREARHGLERIRHAVETTPYTGGGLHIPFTVSAGLYSGRLDGNIEDQIGKADKNLYAAKASGRNRIVG